jgi:hypothetical protein
MDLATEHLDLLRAVDELETPQSSPGTKAAGRRLLEIWQARGGTHTWHAFAPWHGTNPYADELRDEGLLEVHVGMANLHRRDQPAEVAEQYGLSLTEAGRQALADAANE